MPSAQIIRDIEQGSDEWRRLRAGKITASVMHAVLAKGEGKTRDALIRRIAAEIVTGEPLEEYQNEYMARGKEQEPEIRARYALEEGCDPEPVAFILNGRIGCSPDSMIGKRRGLEIKSMRADLLIEVHQRGEVPNRFMPQVQGSMLVSGADEWAIAIGAHEKMPLFKRIVRRDRTYITALENAIALCHEEIDRLVQRIQGWSKL